MSWHLEDAERILRELAGPDVTDPEADAKARKRARIVDAATALFIERGYRKSTIDEVAERAGVAKGTVYLYFKNKVDLLVTAAAREKLRFLGRIKPLYTEDLPAGVRLKRWLVAVFVLAHEMPLASRLMQEPSVLLQIQDEMPKEVLSQGEQHRDDFLAHLIDEAAGDHRWNEVELRDRVKVLGGLTYFSSLVGDERVRRGLSLERYATILADLLIDGLGRDGRGREEK
ncbi:MAG: TetR/AcrR family transcriptional regulator [Myxococcales bacterium]|nr:TetR/AcrR family transcriptional regulator [Myxococcales bacterium]